MNFIIIGKPGSGKGTQASKLAKLLKINHISIGDLLRKKASQKNKVSKKIKKHLSLGDFVPNEIVNPLVEKEIKKNKKGFIVDGYPREMEQALFLEKKYKINKVIYVKCSTSEVIKRLLLRKRRDDNKEAIKERLKDFKEYTEPLIKYYKKKGILVKINGDQDIEAVYKEILRKLDINNE